ncbi:hypothetical protein [Bosea sp. NPDC055594]
MALTPGQAADIKMLPVMLDAAPPAGEPLADKAYDSDAVRENLIGRGMRPVIPNKDDRRDPRADAARQPGFAQPAVGPNAQGKAAGFNVSGQGMDLATGPLARVALHLISPQIPILAAAFLLMVAVALAAGASRVCAFPTASEIVR